MYLHFYNWEVLTWAYFSPLNKARITVLSYLESSRWANCLLPLATELSLSFLIQTQSKNANIQTLTRHPLITLTHSPVQGRNVVIPLQWEQYCILTKPRPHSLDIVAFSAAFTTSPASASSRLSARPTARARDKLLTSRRGWGPKGLTSCRVIRRQSSWLAEGEE